jgi:hypothetical protein
LATKKSRLPTAFRNDGFELPFGRMSFTRLAVVPSLFHSSMPVEPLLAANHR